MENQDLYVNESLRINVKEYVDSISIEWTGKSIDRNPGKFITPILVNALSKTSQNKKRIVLDFQRLDYMNSSTITPIIKILDRAKRGSTRVTALYDKSLKWQDLAFSALEIFQTVDKRVEIKGM
jgi:hypothetical protein